MAPPQAPYSIIVHPYTIESSPVGAEAYEHVVPGSSHPSPTSSLSQLSLSDPGAPENAIIFIGGLGDGPLTVPYARPVAERLRALDSSYSMFEVRMTSSFSGWAFSSLAQDVADISALVKYLRGIGKKKIVLFGHSTGSQVGIHQSFFFEIQGSISFPPTTRIT